MSANDTLGGASKQDIALATIIGIMILVGLVVVATYVMADKSELKIVGTIDVGDYSTIILMGAGGALVYLGIVARDRLGNGNAPTPT